MKIKVINVRENLFVMVVAPLKEMWDMGCAIQELRHHVCKPLGLENWSTGKLSLFPD
jgi:hypothetical protein